MQWWRSPSLRPSSVTSSTTEHWKKIMNPKIVSFAFVVVTAVLVTMVTALPPAYYGECEDRIPHLCREELQPHYCYLPHNRNICCNTCRRHQTSDPGCLYGDHHTTIVRKDANGVETNYNCQGYVGFYGRFHCQEPEFRANCCQSCKVQTA